MRLFHPSGLRHAGITIVCSLVLLASNGLHVRSAQTSLLLGGGMGSSLTRKGGTSGSRATPGGSNINRRLLNVWTYNSVQDENATTETIHGADSSNMSYSESKEVSNGPLSGSIDSNSESILDSESEDILDQETHEEVDTGEITRKKLTSDVPQSPDSDSTQQLQPSPYSSEQPPAALGVCVCVLDFDETLRIVAWDGDVKNMDTPAPDALKVIGGCKDKGCQIAIASANGNRDKLTKILPLIDPATFTDDFFDSQAFQYGEHDKEKELRRILDFFSASANCVAFFDDMEHNRVYATRADGVHFEKVEGSTGVTMGNFYNAMKTLQDMSCPAIDSNK